MIHTLIAYKKIRTEVTGIEPMALQTRGQPGENCFIIFGRFIVK